MSASGRKPTSHATSAVPQKQTSTASRAMSEKCQCQTLAPTFLQRGANENIADNPVFLLFDPVGDSDAFLFQEVRPCGSNHDCIHLVSRRSDCRKRSTSNRSGAWSTVEHHRRPDVLQIVTRFNSGGGS